MITKLLDKLDNHLGPIIFIVHDIGHGNWNEIRFGKTRIFFDIGAQKEWRGKRVRKLVDTANITQEEDIYIFISHWDTDHYHAILKLTVSELKRVKGVFAPQRIPATNTAKNVEDFLHAAGISIDKIPFSVKKSTDNKIELNLFYGGKILRIYRSSKTSSRNLDSLVFYMETKERSLLLTGDQKYEKLYSYILDTVFPKRPLILVLPHHGGYAGYFDKKQWSKVSLEEIIISYHSSNKYEHPLKENYSTAEDLLLSKLLIYTNDTGNKSFFL